jgi:membrane protein implicated in regulation of membrane protease activity
MYVGLLLLLITGIITAFVGHWWGRVWIWLSIVLLIFIAVSMYFMGSQYYSRVRKAIGAPYMEKNKPQPPLEPASPETIDALLENRRAVVLTIIGFGGIAIIAWLMMYKPF